MNTIRHLLLLIIVSVIISGCARIPNESVLLNQEVGTNITTLHQFNIKLVNLYFSDKKKEIDEMTAKAVDTFFASIINQIEDGEQPDLNEAALRGLQERITDYYTRGSEYKSQLEKTRVFVVDRLEQRYQVTIQANTAITELLQSHVELEETTKYSLQRLGEVGGLSIDFLEVQDTVDEYLKRAGESAGEALDLYERIKALFDSQKE